MKNLLLLLAVCLLGVCFSTPEVLAQSQDDFAIVRILAPNRGTDVPANHKIRIVGITKNPESDRVTQVVVEVRAGAYRKTYVAHGVSVWSVTIKTPRVDGRFSVIANAMNARGRERGIPAFKHYNAVDQYDQYWP